MCCASTSTASWWKAPDHGVYRQNAAQDDELITERCRKAGFRLLANAEQEGQFHQQYVTEDAE